MSEEKFWVVFEYTAAAGGYCGVRTSTCFSNKAHFEQWLKESSQILEREKIIAQGVTLEQAVSLTKETPLKCRITAALQEATTKDGIDENVLVLEIQNIIAIICS